MVLTKRQLRKVYISVTSGLTVVFLLIGLGECIWIYHAPLMTILMVELIIIGAAALGGVIGWLIARKIYPQLQNEGKKPGQNGL
jgi:hypothetical protein